MNSDFWEDLTYAVSERNNKAILELADMLATAPVFGKEEVHIHLKQTDVTNPSHYRMGNIEVIDFILDQQMDYLEGNAIKYISRYKYKNGLEDLRKAKWYLNKLIKLNNGESN